MKLSQIKDDAVRKEFTEKGYMTFSYDRHAMRKRTRPEPVWVHFGTGNIFRAFPAAVLDRLLDEDLYDKGVIAVEGFDEELIDRAYRPFDDLSLLVTLKSDGDIEKRVIGSVAESLTADLGDGADCRRLKEIFESSSLQMVSFTITEKGYTFNADDTAFPPENIMGKIAYLLHVRYKAGAYPLAMVSMDNCSHNGDRLKASVLAYAEKWERQGLAGKGFTGWLNDGSKVSFPLSMIDKITPRPDAHVVEMLRADGFEDTGIIVTQKNTYTAAFVNAEEVQYLVIEDSFPAGRPPLERVGIYFTDRQTVDMAEKMKVCTCLNPLHTALAVFGCLLSYDLIWREMKDEDLSSFVRNMAYTEGMPVVSAPGIISPEMFLREVLEKRLVNPFMPDTPQRIACDTSQKLPVRFGVTLNIYKERGEDLSKLKYIPAVFAGYLRYLTSVNDNGDDFEPSPDPLLGELTEVMKDYRGFKSADTEGLRPILSRTEIFGVDLYETGLAVKVTELFNKMNEGPGKVREVLRSIHAERSDGGCECV